MSNNYVGKLNQNRFKAIHVAPTVLAMPSVPVKLPTGPFRVHPDPDKHWKSILLARMNDRWHLVDPELIAQGIFVKGMVPMTGDLYLCIDANDDLFLLPSTHNPDIRFQSWRKSLLPIIAEAQDKWMTMTSDSARKVFVGKAGRGSLPHPRWSKIAMASAFDVAFSGRVIDEAFYRASQNKRKESRREVVEEE